MAYQAANDEIGQALAGQSVAVAPEPTPLGRLGRLLLAERERWVLWLSVAYGAGVGIYFALTFEPPVWSGPAALAAAAVVAWATPHRLAIRWAALLIAFAAAGLTTAELHRVWRAAPVLETRSRAVVIEGRLVDLDRREQGWRAVIAPTRITNYGERAPPAKLRVRLRESEVAANPGDYVKVRALLMPPPGPSLPGGYDFQRDAYFMRLGAVGFAIGPLSVLLPPDGVAPPSWRLWLQGVRAEMTRRIEAVLPGAVGGMAAALITGKRGAIDTATIEAFRDSGLSHLLAIAGLHMSLVGGFVFLVTRAGLALIPWIALRWPIKKIAALTALATLAMYLCLSGAAVATQRAFVMNGLVLVAILIDRMRLSMRVCALAAVLVLAINPAGLAGASFQLSFGAVVALVAYYEDRTNGFATRVHRWGPVGWVLGHAHAVIVTTIIATIGTEAFSIYQFNHLALYAPLANLIAVPLSAVWTMPLALLACLLMPFGLEALALAPMGWGIGLTMRVADQVAGLPGNVWATPSLPTWGIVTFAAGGLWLCLWQRSWRWFGVIPMIAALGAMLTTRPPDLLLSGDGLVAAIRANGVYRASSVTKDVVTSEEWRRAAGDTVIWPLLREVADGPVACVPGSCRWRGPDGRSLLVILDQRGVAGGCPQAAAIVSLVRLGRACHDKRPSADPIDAWRSGAQAIWLDDLGARIESADAARGDRPWVLRRKRKKD